MDEEKVAGKKTPTIPTSYSINTLAIKRFGSKSDGLPSLADYTFYQHRLKEVDHLCKCVEVHKAWDKLDQRLIDCSQALAQVCELVGFINN